MAESLGPDNKRFKMLKAMGFQEGEGLGAEGQGRKGPIPVQIRKGKTGLGWSKT